MLESRLNATNFENDKLQLKVVQKEVAMKPLTKTTLKLEESGKSLETEKWMLLNANEYVLSQSSLKRSLLHGDKKTLVDKVSNDFICIAVKVEDAIPKWCGIEVAELRG